MNELGAGGGQGDLDQHHELEVGDTGLVGQLMALCTSKLQGQAQLLAGVLQMLTSFITEGVQAVNLDDSSLAGELKTSLSQEGDEPTDMDELSLDKLVLALAKIVTKDKHRKMHTGGLMKAPSVSGQPMRSDGLPKRIVCIFCNRYGLFTDQLQAFPYARHSSYNELCLLIDAFKPKDIYPCTVDKANWTTLTSMSTLFGHIYEAPRLFRHDQEMLGKNGKSMPRDDQSIPPSLVADPGPTLKQGSTRQKRTTSKTVSEAASRRNEGDYWPPLEVDHYSPPPERNNRRVSTPSDHGEEIDGRGWPGLSKADIISAESVRQRWDMRLGSEWNPTIPKKRPSHEQSTEYGRLSPPKVTENYKFGPARGHGGEVFQKLHSGQFNKRRQNSSSGMSPRVKIGLRQEAFDAVASSVWSDVGLVSVGGHQEEEEEL